MGNFRVEPPGLFRGRGEHPKMGKLKARIWPEDITINVGEGAPVPAVPDLGDGKRHRWGDVVHDNTVTWLAKWMDSINGAAVAAASARAVRERRVVTPSPARTALQATSST